jgi:hypothetical protein
MFSVSVSVCKSLVRPPVGKVGEVSPTPLNAHDSDSDVTLVFFLSSYSNSY